MKIETQFELRQRIRIKELNREGTINAIMIDDAGIAYRVRYFDNCKCEQVWFYDFELESL